MKRFTLLIAIIAAGLASASAQEYGVQFTRYAGHIITAGSTTTNVTTGHDRVLHTIVFNVTGTPTSEVITIVDQTPVTPKIIYKSAALSSATTTPVVVALPVGIKCTGGIDILTTGTVGTGVVDAWLSYR